MNNECKIIGTMGISQDVTKWVKEKKETEKYKKVAIGQNMRMIEQRGKAKDVINELEKNLREHLPFHSLSIHLRSKLFYLRTNKYPV